MKKYILPTFVSLILSGGYVLADDAPETPPAPKAALSAPAQPSDSPQVYQEMMEKRMVEIEKHREQQMADMEKHREHQMADMEKHRSNMEKRMEQQRADMEKQRAQQETYMQEVQAIAEKLSQAQDPEEQQRLVDEMEKKQQEMWKHLPSPFGMEPRNGFGPWGGPRNMEPRNGFGPNWGGPRGGMPPHFGPRPNFRNIPNRGMPPVNFEKPQRFNRQTRSGHHAQMEQHLENIETLLKEVVELLKSK